MSVTKWWRHATHAVLSDHLLGVNVSALETAERQLAAPGRGGGGMASNYDELRAEVEVSNFRARVLQARNNKGCRLHDAVRADRRPRRGAQAAWWIRFHGAEDIAFDAALRTALENGAPTWRRRNTPCNCSAKM